MSRKLSKEAGAGGGSQKDYLWVAPLTAGGDDRNTLPTVTDDPPRLFKRRKYSLGMHSFTMIDFFQTRTGHMLSDRSLHCQYTKTTAILRGEEKTLLLFLHISSSRWTLRPSTGVYLSLFSPTTHHCRKTSPRLERWLRG